MYFKNPQELVEFFNGLDLEKSTLVFKEEATKKACACGGSGPCQCPPKKDQIQEAAVTIVDPNKVLVESFSDDPQFELNITEGEENVFYVNDYEAIENACGTGRVEFGDTVTFMNMCEMEGKASVTLTVIVEGKRMVDVPFTLSKTADEPHRMWQSSGVADEEIQR